MSCTHAGTPSDLKTYTEEELLVKKYSSCLLITAVGEASSLKFKQATSPDSEFVKKEKIKKKERETYFHHPVAWFTLNRSCGSKEFFISNQRLKIKEECTYNYIQTFHIMSISSVILMKLARENSRHMKL